MATGALEQLRDWYLTDVLPRWLARGWDQTSGHFHEGLARDARPLPTTELRTRTAARMIYTYADAARLGVGPAAGLAAAQAAGTALIRDAALDGGGYCRSFDRVTGATLDEVCDLYDCACVVLAFAALYRTTGDHHWLTNANQLLIDIDQLLVAPAGGWAEDTAGTVPRRHNPHMHMFEALLVLAAASPDPEHITRLQQLEQLLINQFIGPAGLLHEFFGPHWQLEPQWKSHQLDPGHMAEWAWLLHAATPLTGNEHTARSLKLLAQARTLGQDPAAPDFVVDAVDPQGQPVTASRRLWPQVELIKACLATGNASQAQQTAAALFTSYLAATPAGTWRDHFDLAGNDIAATIPASSGYHLWTAVCAIE